MEPQRAFVWGSMIFRKTVSVWFLYVNFKLLTMIKQFTASDIAYLYFLVLAACGILFNCFDTNKKILFTRWLLFTYSTILITLFIIFLLRTRLILHFPHLFRVGPVFALLYMPFSYLYVRTVLTQKQPRYVDWLHGLPALLYAADYLPLFLSSADVKIAMLNDVFKKPYLITVFSQGAFLPEQFHIFMIALSPIVYWMAQLFITTKALHVQNSSIKNASQYWLKWIMFYLVFQLMLFMPVLLIYVSNDPGNLFPISHIFAVTGSAFIIISLFAHPDLFIEQHAPNSDNGNHQEKKRILRNLTQKQINLMRFEVQLLLERQQPFLKHGYTLQEMATSLSVPLYQLSALINHEYGMSFNDFINKYRIEHAIAITKQGRDENLNFNELASQCGFNNRNSFTTAFKKFTGYTPSEYFKAHP